MCMTMIFRVQMCPYTTIAMEIFTPPVTSSARVTVKCRCGTHASFALANSELMLSSNAMQSSLEGPLDTHPRSALVSGGRGSSIAGPTTAEVRRWLKCRGSDAKVP